MCRTLNSDMGVVFKMGVWSSCNFQRSIAFFFPLATYIFKVSQFYFILCTIQFSRAAYSSNWKQCPLMFLSHIEWRQVGVCHEGVGGVSVTESEHSVDARLCRISCRFHRTSLISSIIHEHVWKILFIKKIKIVFFKLVNTLYSPVNIKTKFHLISIWRF